MSQPINLQGFTRAAAMRPETSKFLELMGAAIAQLNMDTVVWRTIRETARSELESVVREAATGNNPNLLLGSPQFQQRVIELTVRLELLEELIGKLPLHDQEAIALAERKARSRI